MFRSQSGPGLSISTSAANALSTPSTAPPPSGGAQTKSLFGNITSQPQQQTSSLFSAPKTAQLATSSQPAGGLFGAAPSTAQNQSAGLFGGQSSNLNAANMFGTQQSQTQASGDMFGATSAQNQGNASSSLFGAHSNTQPQNSLFGAGPAQSQPLASTLQRPPTSIFANSIGQQPQQQTVPGVRISVNELRPTTRFNDLHDELQKAIESVDAFILNKIKWQEQCDAVNATLEEMSTQLAPDVEYCNKNLDVVQQALENDARSIASAKNVVKTDAMDAKLSFQVINNLKLPQQFHQTNLWATAPTSLQMMPRPDDEEHEGTSRNLIEYFSKQVDEQSKVLDSYKRNLKDVESYLKDMEANAQQQVQQLGSSRTFQENIDDTGNHVRELAAVLREFERGILGVATKVGSAREKTQEIMLN